MSPPLPCRLLETDDSALVRPVGLNTTRAIPGQPARHHSSRLCVPGGLQPKVLYKTCSPAEAPARLEQPHRRQQELVTAHGFRRPRELVVVARRTRQYQLHQLCSVSKSFLLYCSWRMARNEDTATVCPNPDPRVRVYQGSGSRFTVASIPRFSPRVTTQT
jgi:hypothetical protein